MMSIQLKLEIIENQGWDVREADLAKQYEHSTFSQNNNKKSIIEMHFLSLASSLVLMT